MAGNIGELEIEWLNLPDVAEAFGLEVTRVRTMLRDGRLLAARPNGPLAIPATFIVGSEVVKGLPGTITLLRDAGYSDEDAIRWLHTADDSLPGTPVQALRDNRGREVKRRAQALGF